MNNTIFDWESHCEHLIHGGKYLDVNHQFKEQSILMKYLADKGYTKGASYQIWLKTNPPILQKMTENAEDQDEIDFFFNKIWRNKNSYVINKYPPILIYQDEIDYLNNIVELIWIKQYLLTLLCIYKYYGEGWLKFSASLRAFCFSATETKRERVETATKLSNCINQHNCYNTMAKDGMQLIKVNYAHKEIDNDNELPIATIRDPREVEKLFDLLTCKKYCTQCGNLFNYNSHTFHSKLCPVCMRLKRIADQYTCHKNQEKRKREAEALKENKISDKQ